MTEPLNRRAAVAHLLRHRKDALVVTGLGAPTYDVAAAGDTPRNFYLWGAMGGASSIALGLALAQPGTPVVVVTGDGEMLMGMGSFATIALQAPRNLTIVVLDNGLYGETGAQKSHTSQTDLAAVALACGIARVDRVASEAELAEVATRFPATRDGPHVIVVKIAPADNPRLLPVRDGAHAKARTRLALGLPVD
jgi:thiamine pyrophosphate-dependent acetolactate synthase large subunit-like protein